MSLSSSKPAAPRRVLPPLPGYLSVREAAEQLGVSPRSVYGYIARRQLAAALAGSKILLSEEAVKTFQQSSVGRPRCHTPPWRAPLAENPPFLLSVEIALRPGQEPRLKEKLKAAASLCAWNAGPLYHHLPGEPAGASQHPPIPALAAAEPAICGGAGRRVAGAACRSGGALPPSCLLSNTTCPSPVTNQAEIDKARAL